MRSVSGAVLTGAARVVPAGVKLWCEGFVKGEVVSSGMKYTQNKVITTTLVPKTTSKLRRQERESGRGPHGGRKTPAAVIIVEIGCKRRLGRLTYFGTKHHKDICKRIKQI
mmetsp:Transcript_102155/g.284467  ORF Transcript_102155/g.284467 Transcript_102155/m.284467 type:complete len:111 (+) Transcript_102155:626-958(+)